MNWVYVTSSNLQAVRYDRTTQTLEVLFHDGSVYQYLGVPEHYYHGLLAAGSHGSYLDAYIKKGGFPYRRIQ